MTQAQERYRIAVLTEVAPTLLDGVLGALVTSAAALAESCILATSDPFCGPEPLPCALYAEALHSVGQCLFQRLVGTSLCAPEPPDLAGARVLVRCALRTP